MRQLNNIVFLLGILGLSSTAHAACTAGKTLFSCTTTNNKYVELCDNGATLQYSFGKAGQTPELALSVPRARASTYQWQGVGRWINYRVRIPNGNTFYEVFDSVDRVEQTAEAGIYVEASGKNVATINCKMDTLVSNLDGVKLRPTE